MKYVINGTKVLYSVLTKLSIYMYVYIFMYAYIGLYVVFYETKKCI